MSQTGPINKPETIDQQDSVHPDVENEGVTTPDDKHGESNLDDDSSSAPSPNDKTTANGEAVDQASKSVPSLLTRKKDQKTKHNDRLAIITLQIILLVFMIFLGMQYSWLHNVPHILSPIVGNQDIEAFAEAIATYDFIGVSPENPEPSIFAVVLEVAIWSLAGVLARSEYYLAQIVIKKKPFSLLESISKLISDGSMGIAIAIAVVVFLRATEFVNLSLRTADVASIAAISFILGFYHEDTRRLLGSFRRTISAPAKEAKEEENTE